MEKKYQYQKISIWLSLLIIALFFVTAASEKWRGICAPLSFLTGALLYTAETIRWWILKRRVFCFLQAAVVLLMLFAFVFYFLQQRGFL